MSRPFTSRSVVQWITVSIDMPPPSKRLAPVSPSQPVSWLVPSVPTIHTIAFEPAASVVVTMGEPLPPEWAHHTVFHVGGLVGVIWTATRSPPPVAGQLVPPPPSTWTTTYV